MQQVRWDTLARALKYVHAHSQNTPCVVYPEGYMDSQCKKESIQESKSGEKWVL